MRTTEGLISYIHSHRAALLLFYILACCVSFPHLPHMGRPSTKSVARIYPDVNSKLGPSWYEYGPSSVPHYRRTLRLTHA